MFILLAFVAGSIACTQIPTTEDQEPSADASTLELARTNLHRSMEIVSSARKNYLTGEDMALSRFYNPFTGIKSAERGSVWMYTTAIEAVNSILSGMTALKEAGDPCLYDHHYQAYSKFLSDLVDNLEYYAGTYTLVSYTQTREWTVYAVNRSSRKGGANVQGRENVYDDQEWLAIELLEAYRVTGEERYLEKAEYLISYVLDGWDCTIGEDGHENGGIVWGPGYYTKHSCSNGPMVAPLVKLAALYEGRNDQISYRYIGDDGKRLSKDMPKSEYYLMFARKIYDFQRNHLFKKSNGVYWDMLGAKGLNGDNICYETVDGVRYRGHNPIQNPIGKEYSYNSGTMLSGAAALYGATGEKRYLEELTKLSNDAFRFFAHKSAKYSGMYEYDVTGFNPWFNDVLLRGWLDISAHYGNVKLNVGTFQKNLDYAWEHHLQDHMLPTNLLAGWNLEKGKNATEAMFTFAYAAEYGYLAEYYLENK